MGRNGQGTIPDDWIGEYCRYAVCWPNSEQWRAVLRGVLTIPARGRFWDEHTGSILEAQSVIRETFDTNLHLEEVIMACNDPGLAEIADALRAISISMAGNNCCDRRGSGGQEAVGVPLNPIVVGSPAIDPPPDGFESWDEFFTDKCAIAWNIVEELENDIGEMAILNLGSISLSSLAALLAIAFATPIPFDDIVAIAALLLTVIGEIIITTTLSIINDNEEELVCELYNGQSPSDSRNLFLSRFADFVDVSVADPVQAFAINSLMAYMLGSAVVNRLYEKDLTRVWPSRDCFTCQPLCATYEFETDLEDWGPFMSFRTPVWDSTEGGGMLLDGRGAGGNNWSYAVLTSSDLASKLGIPGEPIFVESLTANYRIRAVMPPVTVFFGVHFVNISEDGEGGQTNLTDESIHEVSFTPPSLTGELDYVLVFSGNQTVSAGNVLQTLILDIEFCIST